MRAFIALEVPKEVKKEIGKIQEQLRKVGIQARWVNPKICHLTLAFLGSITPDKIEPIGKILNEVAGPAGPISLQLKQISFFPNLQGARIVFISLNGEIGKLNILVNKIRKKLKESDVWFDEKPFSPHLTLGRLKTRQNLTKLISQRKINQIQFQISKINLVKSILSASGPIYQNLISCHLKRLL